MSRSKSGAHGGNTDYADVEHHDDRDGNADYDDGDHDDDHDNRDDSDDQI